MLPDALGYALIAVGASRLVAHSGKFAGARCLFWIVAVLALVDYFPLDSAAVPLGWIQLISSVVAVWVLFGGLEAYARRADRCDLAERARQCRVIYVVGIVGTVFLTLARNELALAGVGVTLIALILMLLLIHRLKIEIDSAAW